MASRWKKKSDQGGIEMNYCQTLFFVGVVKKSDQGGIEIVYYIGFRHANEKKSDQGGIEMLPVVA